MRIMAEGYDRKKNAWLKYNESQRQQLFALNQGYKDFISKCKTETECALEVIKMAREEGFADLNSVDSLKPGDKVYYNNMDKAVALFVIGERPLEDGM